MKKNKYYFKRFMSYSTATFILWWDKNYLLCLIANVEEEPPNTFKWWEKLQNVENFSKFKTCLKNKNIKKYSKICYQPQQPILSKNTVILIGFKNVSK